MNWFDVCKTGMQHAGQTQGQNTMHQPTPLVIYRGPVGTPTTNQPGGETAAATPAAAAPKPAAKKRVFKGLKIVNPDTKEEVKVVKPKPKAVEEVAKKEDKLKMAGVASTPATSVVHAASPPPALPESLALTDIDGDVGMGGLTTTTNGAGSHGSDDSEGDDGEHVTHASNSGGLVVV